MYRIVMENVNRYLQAYRLITRYSRNQIIASLTRAAIRYNPNLY